MQEWHNHRSSQPVGMVGIYVYNNVKEVSWGCQCGNEVNGFRVPAKWGNSSESEGFLHFPLAIDLKLEHPLKH